MKHNKKRNTAFIYEALALELTKALLKKNNVRKQTIFSLLQEHFGARSTLAEERSLYAVLLETNNIQEKVAQRLLDETKKARSALDENAIFDAQSQLIAAINKGLGSGVWSNFVPNFKSLASVNAIFNPKTAVKKRVLFEQSIIDTMSTPVALKTEAELKPLDNLTYRSFIKKFNSKYDNLLQEQKELLNRYITSFADDGLELRLYLNEELQRLKTSLAEASRGELEPFISEKVEGVLNYLESFRRREFGETDLKKVLKTQELVQELQADD